ncbi:MAG: DUF1573 domain-containing protein [Planctomycetota bacterium]
MISSIQLETLWDLGFRIVQTFGERPESQVRLPVIWSWAGLVKSGDKVQRSFYFDFASSIDATVSAVATSCGCTTQAIEERRVDGDQRTCVSVTVEPFGSGEFTQYADVRMDVGDESSVVRLFVFGYVPEVPSYYPKSLDYGRVRCDAAPRELSFSLNEAVQPTDTHGETPVEVQAEIADFVTTETPIRDEDRLTVPVTLDPSKAGATGVIRGYVDFLLKEDVGKLRVPLTVDIASPFSVSKVVELGRIKRDTVTKRSIQLKDLPAERGHLGFDFGIDPEGALRASYSADDGVISLEISDDRVGDNIVDLHYSWQYKQFAGTSVIYVQYLVD